MLNHFKAHLYALHPVVVAFKCPTIVWRLVCFYHDDFCTRTGTQTSGFWKSDRKIERFRTILPWGRRAGGPAGGAGGGPARRGGGGPGAAGGGGRAGRRGGAGAGRY